jgi:hypothetical protein
MLKVPKSPPLLAGNVLVLLVSAFSLRAADPEFPSTWRTAEIVVDGSADDWAGKLVPIPDSPVSLGIQNDGTFLYLCLRTSDEATKKRIQALGVNFYLDGSGKADRAFGVRFPAPAEPKVPRPGEAPSEDGQLVRVRRSTSSDDIGILGRDAEGGGRMKVAQVKPLAAAMGETDGALVIEVKVPLAFSLDTPFAIQTATGKTIALGLEGAQPDKDLRSEGKRGGRGGEGSDGAVSVGRGGVGIGGSGGGVGVGPGGIRAGTGGSSGGFSGGGRGGSGGRGGEARPSGDRPSERSSRALIKKWFRVLLSPPPGPATAPVSPAPRS